MDTQVSQIDSSGNSGADYAGPFYVDNVRIYKGSFAGLHPDEKLIFGLDNTTDLTLFSCGDGAPITPDTDKQVISQGTGSLKIDLTGLTSGWSQGLATASTLGLTLDGSTATAIHLTRWVASRRIARRSEATSRRMAWYGITGRLAFETTVADAQGALRDGVFVASVPGER